MQIDTIITVVALIAGFAYVAWDWKLHIEKKRKEEQQNGIRLYRK